MDFFTVPTITFSALYCFFVISHDRQRILHFNVTKHPRSSWIVQQLREAFPFGSAPRFVIFDRDAKYGLEVPAAVRSLRVNPVRTSFESPWQNGVAERWVGSCRLDLLDHIIAVDERHLKRRLSEYIRYYHEDRTHLGLGKGTPDGYTARVPRDRFLAFEGERDDLDEAAIVAGNRTIFSAHGILAKHRRLFVGAMSVFVSSGCRN